MLIKSVGFTVKPKLLPGSKKLSPDLSEALISRSQSESNIDMKSTENKYYHLYRRRQVRNLYLFACQKLPKVH